MGDVESRAAPTSIPQWSFGRLTTYEGCALHAFYEFGQKRPFAPSYDRTFALRGQAIHTGAEHYIRGEGVITPELSMPLVIERLNQYRAAYADGRAVIEQEWGFTRDWTPTGWHAKDVWQRAKCDVVINEGALVEVVDWKSGKKQGNEVKHAQQGMLYAIDSLIMFPEAQDVRIRFIYTDEGKEKVSTFSRLATMRVMPSWDMRARAMTSATVFPHRANKINCRFCPYAPTVNGGDNSCPYGVEVPRTTKTKAA